MFDWDSWRGGTGSDDLAYMIAMHWYPERRARLESHLLDKYHERIADLTPGTLKEKTGEFFKDVGIIESEGEGPYAHGSGRRLTTTATPSASNEENDEHHHTSTRGVRDHVSGAGELCA